MGEEPCSRSRGGGSTRPVRRFDVSLDEWVSDRVERLRDAFFSALDAGDGDRARHYIDTFEEALAARLVTMQRDAMTDVRRAVERGRAHPAGRVPLTLDQWISRRTELLLDDVIAALEDDDEELAQRHLTDFEAELSRRLTAIEQQVSAVVTVDLTDEVKARRELEPPP